MYEHAKYYTKKANIADSNVASACAELNID